MTRPFDVFKGYIFQLVTEANFLCQKGSLLVVWQPPKMHRSHDDSGDWFQEAILRAHSP